MTKSPLSRVARLLLLASATLSTTAFAATLHVATWGFNYLQCGKANDPCASVSQALVLSKPGGRIVVAPGTYTDRIIVNFNGQGQALTNVRIESTAGAHATTVEALVSSDHVLTIGQRGVRIGGPGKGFTFRGATGTTPLPDSVAGIRVDATHCRIEGNRFTGNNVGLMFPEGERCIIRNNVVENNLNHGMRCTSTCDGAQIIGNRIQQNNGDGLHVVNGRDLKVRQNLFLENTGAGLYYDSDAEGGLIRDNTISGNGLDGIALDDGEGKTIRGNILANNGSDGMELDHSLLQKFVKVEHNLAVSNTVAGINLDGIGLTVSRNSAVQNGTSGFVILNPTTFHKLDRNNSIDNGCGIHLFSTEQVVTTRHFFVESLENCGPNAADITNSNEATKPNKTNINRARKVL
jgi:parallel beta-helix repeat protein